jgi:hypothetical protein
MSEHKNTREQVQEEEPRRDFMKKAGSAGLAAGFAHFLLVGGEIKKAFAEADACPDGISDVCQPSQDNPDVCIQHGTPPTAFTGDECESGAEPEDLCHSDGPNLKEIDDVCAADGIGGDVCATFGGTDEVGDSCVDGVSGDVCGDAPDYVGDAPAE